MAKSAEASTQKGSAGGHRFPAPPPIDDEASSNEKREYPRARLTIPFRLWLDRDGSRAFSATVESESVSVSGAFLKSTFFLPTGTELLTRFQWEDAPPVEAKIRVLRNEAPEGRGKSRTGFAVQFVEFFSQTEVTLARLFLARKLGEFVEQYLRSPRAKTLQDELDRVVDVLAAWELLKVTHPGDPWRPA